MRNLRFVAIALALAAMAVFLPLRASTAWALPGPGTPTLNVLEQIQGANSLKTDVRARRYYPRYRYAGRGYRNYGYRNYGYRNYGYRNYGYRNYGRYNWRNHGPRYAYRYPGYNYFYGGFWYASPWWNYGYANDYYDGGDAHVAWCLNRYRSYDPRTDTFMGYDGRRRYCRSPY
ncbi:BA14K family protein [Aestuariivirga sp.]|uniref:BA14K family protein n=1 Tax=Aestuariivirga sp. TaxID=2650926 RepID=UPI0035945368